MKQFDVEFENLSLKLGNGMEIMSGVTGHLHSGRTCAIMGPSGSGKTTFVTLLMGKAKRTSGIVRVNGKEQELSKFKKLIGYVPQDDVMLRELTVRDILLFSARMRLPADWKDDLIQRKVEEVIRFLGLSHVADSIIGDETTRGISGGQRKRVNIGMELVAEPSVLFLDEPTSGLDSSTSFQVCQMLRKVAREKKLTVAAVIHSPSPATFNQFDDLLLFGEGGKIIYFGPREDATAYFDMVGFTCPPGASAADFYMEVVSGRVPNCYDYNFHPKDLFKYWDVYKEGNNPFQGRQRVNFEPEVVADVRRKSQTLLDNHYKKKSSSEKAADIVKAFQDVFREVIIWTSDVSAELWDTLKSIAYFVSREKDPVRETPSLYRQLILCTQRSFYQVYRSATRFIADLLLHLGVGTFISIAIQNMTYIGRQPDDVCAIAPGALFPSCVSPVDTLKEAGMFVCLGALFAGISVGSSSFGKEKVVYWRDTATGMSTIAYFLGKLCVDLPRMLIGGIIYSAALALFFPNRQSWFTILWIVEALYFVAFGMGYFMSYAVSEKSVALAGTGFALLWSLVLSGVIPQLDDVYKDGEVLNSLSFLWDISPPRWGIEAFWIKEVSARPFVVVTPSNGYNWDNYGKAIGLMILIGLVWHIIAFFWMKLTNRAKQK